jgi:hypothetical protein
MGPLNRKGEDGNIQEEEKAMEFINSYDLHGTKYYNTRVILALTHTYLPCIEK